MLNSTDTTKMPKGFKGYRQGEGTSQFRLCDICDRKFQMKTNNKLCRKMLILHMKKEHGIENYKPSDIIIWTDADNRNFSTQTFSITNKITEATLIN